MGGARHRTSWAGVAATLVGAGFTLSELERLPLRSWAAFYAEVEAARLMHYGRMVGVVHPKSPARAQREFFKRAVRILRGGGPDLLRDPKALRRRILGMPGVGVAAAAKAAPPGPEGGDA